MHVSSLPLLLDCPSSQLPTEHPYDVPSDASELGSAVHDGMASHVDGHPVDTPSLAKSYGVAERDLGPLLAYGRMAWDEIKDDSPNPTSEVALMHSTLDLMGRTDVLSIGDDGDLAVTDWKTNRERKDVRGQLLGYAACAADLFGLGPRGTVKTYTVWIRLGEIDCDEVGAAELSRFGDRLARARKNIGRQYSPGEACTFCRRQLVCEARQEYVRSAAVAFGPVAAGMELEPGALPKLYSQAKALGKALDQYRDALRMLLRAHGPQSDGQGGTVDLITRAREDIDPLIAWPILTGEGYNDADMAGCVSLSSGAVYDVIAAKAAKGRKGKEKARLKQLLRDGNAMARREYQAIQLKKGTTDGRQ